MNDKRLIDADEVIRGMEQIMNSPWFKDDKYTLCVKKDAFNIVKNLCVDAAPTIDAVPVMHGQWEKVQVWKGNPQTTLRCSLCKTNQPIYEHEEWKFCPFCGQPMDAKDMDVPTKDGGAR